MSDSIFLAMNYKIISRHILGAKKFIFLAIPGITEKLADDIIASSKKIGWENINIVLDPSPKVYYIGFGEYNAFDKLVKSGCVIKCQDSLRIGMLIVDDLSFVFSPISLNIESDQDTNDSVNAIEFNQEHANFIKDAVLPDKSQKEPEIGAREISEMEIRIVATNVLNHPPKKADLTRKINVLTSQFQFVDMSFRGSQIQNTKISLNATELGIKDPELVKRITGQFKVFEQLPIDYEEGIRNFKKQYDEIKKCYTRTIGTYGTVIFKSSYNSFEKSLGELNQSIQEFSKNMANKIMNEINSSKERLRRFLVENYKDSDQNSFSQQLSMIKNNSNDRWVDNIISQAFSAYTEKFLEQIMEIKYHFYDISPQMIEDEGFNKKIKEVLNISLDELIAFEEALTLKSN